MSAVRFSGRGGNEREPGFALAYEAYVRLSGPEPASATLGCPLSGRWEEREPLTEVACDQVLELAVPLAALGFPPEGRVRFAVALGREDVLLETFPARGAIELDLSVPPAGGRPT